MPETITSGDDPTFEPIMAKQKDSKAKAESTPRPPSKSALESTAEAIGSALGTIARTTGIADGPAAEPHKEKRGRLQPKNKSRLPRKEKKRRAAKAGNAG